MSKAGLHVMTESLAVEWARHGIRLNAIAPGPFPVESTSARLNPGQTMEERAAAKNPTGRIGAMHELQNLAAFLMADGCDWLTGQTIALDGAGHLAGTGTFYDLRSWTDADWQRAREAIKGQNEKDRAQRSV
jgi:NAD(P)-dependent dehydrogenase (short-subunit alcohol dehydrogenase family)